ncbi:MAG TPA: hypothetical protein VF579_09875 [Candidatus Methylomirabilis sp.]
MPRPIFTLLAELQATLAELAEALNPLQKLVSTFKGHDGPFPMKPAGKKRAPRKRRTGWSAAPTKAARKLVRRSKGTSARLALQGKYMSALRKLSKADQAEVKKVRAEQGVEAALKVAAARAS